VALTIYGAVSVTFMVVMYALERRSRHFVAAFAVGCGLSSAYGFLAGTWPFGAVEAVWMLVALRRYRTSSAKPSRSGRGSRAPSNISGDPRPGPA
jgi:hypothetical protein